MMNGKVLEESLLPVRTVKAQSLRGGTNGIRGHIREKSLDAIYKVRLSVTLEKQLLIMEDTVWEERQERR